MKEDNKEDMRSEKLYTTFEQYDGDRDESVTFSLETYRDGEMHFVAGFRLCTGFSIDLETRDEGIRLRDALRKIANEIDRGLPNMHEVKE